MTTKLKVTYLDGREVSILASARAQINTERHFKSTGQAQVQQIEASFYLAWAALIHAGKESADFEQWADGVADAEIVEKDAEDERATDPTPPVPEPIGSSA